jgi:uncharacterized membrane protein
MSMHSRVRIALAVLAMAAYTGLCHWLTSIHPEGVFSQATVLGPMCLVGVLGLWSDGLRLAAVLVALAVAALLGLCGSGVLAVPWLYLAQHAGVNLALGWWFGRTLQAGRQPLISGLAERVHGELVPAMVTYTRAVTQVWTLYFLATAALSLLLFLAAPLAVWSFLANIITPAALALLFVGEYFWRYHRHPEFERVSLMDAVRAYQASAQPKAVPVRSHDAAGEPGRAFGPTL